MYFNLFLFVEIIDIEILIVTNLINISHFTIITNHPSWNLLLNIMILKYGQFISIWELN